MSQQTITITVYGREEICASCVGAPGSHETYEWLQAAIGRKYPDEGVQYAYVDMDESGHREADERFITQMEEEDMFYPIVFVNNDMVAEGIPHLKAIYQALEKHGISA